MMMGNRNVSTNIATFVRMIHLIPNVIGPGPNPYVIEEGEA
jgi:hypothetical protein